MTNPEKVSIPYTEWERLRLMENRCDHLEYHLRHVLKASVRQEASTGWINAGWVADHMRWALSTKGDE